MHSQGADISHLSLEHSLALASPLSAHDVSDLVPSVFGHTPRVALHVGAATHHLHLTVRFARLQEDFRAW